MKKQSQTSKYCSFVPYKNPFSTHFQNTLYFFTKSIFVYTHKPQNPWFKISSNSNNDRPISTFDQLNNKFYVYHLDYHQLWHRKLINIVNLTVITSFISSLTVQRLLVMKWGLGAAKQSQFIYFVHL